MQMNEAQSIYKSDFVAYGWYENNCDSTRDDFCSEDNIDGCLRYISQELCALGYPPIYTTSSTCPNAKNCDIVNYVNITYDILRSCSDHAKIKENLEDRNQRLFADFNALCKKNTHLKNNLEQAERNIRSALERERQLKVKNDQLTNALKKEKDEAKKLVSQNLQQRNAYQHEIRKLENNLKQMQTRMNQILSDRNPVKKIASISSSQCLPRANGQRGKWKNEASANSALEEMYNAIISGYENRCQDFQKNDEEYRQCFEYIQSQMSEIVEIFEDDSLCSSDNIVLKSILSGGIIKAKGLKECFQFLFTKVKNKVMERCSTKDDIILEMNALKSKLLEYEKGNIETSGSETTRNGLGHLDDEVTSQTSESVYQSQATSEPASICEEKLELSSCITIKKTNEEIDAQKLSLIKCSMQQRSSPAQWHEELGYIPSISVITKRDGTTGIATANQLKQCLSAPDTFNDPLTPLNKAGDSSLVEALKIRSVSSWPPVKSSFQESELSCTNPEIPKLVDSDLPKWAVSRNTDSPLTIDSNAELDEPKIDISCSAEELEVLSEPSEEMSLQRLKAVMEDIEQRRRQFSPV